VTTPFTATITATSVTDTTKSAILQIHVNPLPVITTTSLPNATAGVAYTATLAETGGSSPFTWTITSGSLPLGLALNPTTGLISGTPTGASSGSLTFKVTDADGKISSQTLQLTVNPPAPLIITTASLANAPQGVAYSQTLQASGGVAPFTWILKSGSLPVGLTLSAAGVISGTPTGATGTSNFSATVTDSQTPTPKSTSANLSITVVVAPLSVTTSTLLAGSVGGSYSQTLQANGGSPPYTWSIIAGALPAGLHLNSSTGAITGSPTTTGTSNFTVKVTDLAAATATAPLSITINSAFTLITTSLPGGSVGKPYTATLTASGGVPPYTWSISSNPSWLSINSSTGVLSGTPTAIGSFSFKVMVVDSGSLATAIGANFTISVAAANCTNDGSLQGNYAFVVNGWSASTFATSVAGSFVADGLGNITAGLVDLADQNATPRIESGAFTGTYCVESTNLATLTLTYSGTLTGGNTFVASLDTADGNGHIISYDSSAKKASGLLRRQDPSAFLTSKIVGDYAFGLTGSGSSQIGDRYAIAGQFNSDGVSTLVGQNDTNDGGALHSSQTFSSSDFTVASTGRGTATITFSTGTTNFVFYVVSSTEMLMMAFDTGSNPVILAGQVLQQSGTPFTDASLDGTSVIELQSTGAGANTPTATAGIFTTTNNPVAFTFAADQNQGGTMATVNLAGTFIVASNGRVVLTPTGGGSVPVLYLIAPNQAFVIGTNPGVDFGLLTPQTGSNLDTAFSGIYQGGSQPPQSVNVNEQAVYLNAAANGNLSETIDSNGVGGPQATTITETYASVPSGPAGKFAVTESGSTVLYLYLISPTQGVAVPVSSTQFPNADPTLIDFHQ
jgi:hypothetical protein